MIENGIDFQILDQYTSKMTIAANQLMDAIQVEKDGSRIRYSQ
mgnify:CR=1 FL=1